MFGNIYKRFNIKWAFLIAVFIFELGSLICAVAQNSTTFIIGRAIAGVSR
jgi:MFS family permease